MYENIATVNGLLLRMPLSGGKAGKGHAKTSNVQIMACSKNGSIRIKQFQFKTKVWGSKEIAIQKARVFAQSYKTHTNE